MSSAPSLLPTPAPQIRRVSRRHCALYKLNLLTYLLVSQKEKIDLMSGPMCGKSQAWELTEKTI